MGLLNLFFLVCSSPVIPFLFQTGASVEYFLFWGFLFGVYFGCKLLTRNVKVFLNFLFSFLTSGRKLSTHSTFFLIFFFFLLMFRYVQYIDSTQKISTFSSKATSNHLVKLGSPPRRIFLLLAVSLRKYNSSSVGSICQGCGRLCGLARGEPIICNPFPFLIILGFTFTI